MTFNLLGLYKTTWANTNRSLANENVRVRDEKSTALAQSFVYRQVVARPYFCICVGTWTVHLAPKKPYAMCNAETDWKRQENIGIPSFACPACNASNLDGAISCFCCDARLEPHSDSAWRSRTEKAKRIAARKGESTFFGLENSAPRKLFLAGRHPKPS